MSGVVLGLFFGLMSCCTESQAPSTAKCAEEVPPYDGLSPSLAVPSVFLPLLPLHGVIRHRAIYASDGDRPSLLVLALSQSAKPNLNLLCVFL